MQICLVTGRDKPSGSTSALMPSGGSPFVPRLCLNDEYLAGYAEGPGPTRGPARP